MTNPKPFGIVPENAEGTGQPRPEPFKVHIDDQQLEDLRTLVRLSPVAKETFDNRDPSDWKFGAPREWMVEAKRMWAEEFDWRKEEARINSFPQFKSAITDDDNNIYNLHFAALFSSKPDAIPIAFFHGWPGSFLEFLPIMDILREKYTPETLPYHIIVPSLPGFAFSDPPPLDRIWRIEDSARLMHKLLLSLGFGPSGYIVQGGDIGSYIARTMAATYPECRAMHLNFMQMHSPPTAVPSSQLTEQEREGLKRAEEFKATGTGYGQLHAHRPSTISHCLSASPLALLAWISEKFYQWSDVPHPSLTTILTHVTLYWLTSSFPTSIYTYKQDFSATDPHSFHGRQNLYINKPIGYSYFPKEVLPVPERWARQTGDCVFFRGHGGGGHFAALERKGGLWGDVEEFVGIVVRGSYVATQRTVKG